MGASKRTSIGAPSFAPRSKSAEVQLPKVESEHALRDHWLGEVMAARSPRAEGWSLTVALDPLIEIDPSCVMK